MREFHFIEELIFVYIWITVDYAVGAEFVSAAKKYAHTQDLQIFIGIDVFVIDHHSLKRLLHEYRRQRTR